MGCLLLSWPCCVIQQQEECVRQPHPSSEECRLGSPALPGFSVQKYQTTISIGRHWRVLAACRKLIAAACTVALQETDCLQDEASVGICAPG